jgi:hypothetical protein
MSQVPRFLTRSAERMTAASHVSQLAPDVDALLLADRLDQACAEPLRAAGLTDGQAREVLALLWTPPQVTEHYVTVATSGIYTLCFNGQRTVKRLIGRLAYGWECLSCYQAEVLHYQTKDEARHARWRAACPNGTHRRHPPDDR